MGNAEVSFVGILMACDIPIIPIRGTYVVYTIDNWDLIMHPFALHS